MVVGQNALRVDAHFSFIHEDETLLPQNTLFEVFLLDRRLLLCCSFFLLRSSIEELVVGELSVIIKLL